MFCLANQFPAPQNTPQAKQDARSQWLHEYEERGFLGNFLHAMGQLAEEVPEATGKALSKTADELANNEELREKLGWALKAGLGTVGAGALPAAINYLGIPAVKYMLQHPELINEATDAVEGFGMPGPPPSSWGGSIGGFLSALGDRL